MVSLLYYLYQYRSKQLNKLKENPLCDVLKNNKMNLIYSIIQVGFSGLGYYYMFIWMPTYVLFLYRIYCVYFNIF